MLRAWLTSRELKAGAVVDFQMGLKPNGRQGSAKEHWHNVNVAPNDIIVLS